MLVKFWMSAPAITVNADDSIQQAVQLMKTNGIRMLPVLADGELVGVLTDRDIKGATPSDQKKLELFELLDVISGKAVKNIMSPNPITVYADTTIEEATLELLLNRISELPVVDEYNEVIGVITRTDIFHMLIKLTGFNNGGIQFAFMLVDKPGAIKQVTDVIRDHGGRIASILTTREGAPLGHLKAYIRACDMDSNVCQYVKQVLRKHARMLYVINHVENSREFYHTD